ncbi:MAG: hypothetical protein HY711_06665 [Candidatus Melainabacteria bacterium]|nr:hypothetical protein [Candidatus Melainabacteria bacterium]
MPNVEREAEKQVEKSEKTGEGGKLTSGDIDTKGVNPQDLFTRNMTNEMVACGGNESPRDVAGAAASNMERANSVGQARHIVEGAMGQGSAEPEQNLQAMQQEFQSRHSPYQLEKVGNDWYVYEQNNRQKREKIQVERHTHANA